MRITFHLFATFRLIAGIKTIPLDQPEGATLRDAMLHVTTIYPALRPHWFDADNHTIHAHVHALLHGEDVVNLPDKWDLTLHAGDEVDFFPPVAGG